MKVLIGCEFSGVVRRAFRARGHDAWSCDLLPAEDGDRHHIQGDVLDVTTHGWDLVIAHPPCTYLCNSGVRWLHTEPGRREKMIAGAAFFRMMLGFPCPRVVVENPIPHRHADLPDYDQLIQPWQFGDGECKATCLWLRGVPPLMPTHVDAPLFGATACEGRATSVHDCSPGPDRGKIRSKTFQGIAQAMAEQWSNP